MTYDEMIAVIQAAKEGKKIQRRMKNCEHGKWNLVDPVFNFGPCDYRVKPEPTIRPYANEVEFIADMAEHGPYFSRDGAYFMPVKVDNDGVTIIGDSMGYEEMVECNWQDGHPCGIEK